MFKNLSKNIDWESVKNCWWKFLILICLGFIPVLIMSLQEFEPIRYSNDPYSFCKVIEFFARQFKNGLLEYSFTLLVTAIAFSVVKRTKADGFSFSTIFLLALCAVSLCFSLNYWFVSGPIAILTIVLLFYSLFLEEKEKRDEREKINAANTNAQKARAEFERLDEATPKQQVEANPEPQVEVGGQ
ncbi:MAG: hypothetical protein FWE50_03510 [Alphaproteobacteria bacterium]|nr:hypothetical protein [Alphaproteobacteria bacterium]